MKYLFISLVFFISVQLHGQAASDTTIIADQDTTNVAQSKNTFGDLFKGEPGRAALYSLILPGGGQIYNRKWWKVPIAIGIDAFTLYNVIDSRKIYKGYESQYLYALNNDGTDYDINRLKYLRNASRKQYDYNRVYLVLGHLLTVFDAYVDRHLMDFDISDDLSVSPAMMDRNFNMGMNLSYSLTGSTMKKKIVIP